MASLTSATELTTATDRWQVDQQPTTPPLHYQPFPKQRLFHNSPARYRLFGGAAGPGKSKALVMEAVLVANEREDGRGINTLLLRRTHPELEASLLLRFRADVPRELYREFNETKKLVTWWNGATTRFGSMQHEKDVWSYQGTEYAFIGWDELTQFAMKQWDTMKVWNRCPIPEVFAGMAGTTNPIGPGVMWVKALFVDKKAPAQMEEPWKYNPREYDFIPATIIDNPIYANDRAYLHKLQALPPRIRAAMLEGRWDVALGTYFDNFNHALHVCRRAAIGIEPWWPRWMSIDWGFEHPAAMHMHCSSPAGRHATYREWSGNHLEPVQLTEAILEACTVSHAGKNPVYEVPQKIYLSPDAFGKKQGRSTIARQMTEVFRRAGFPVPQPALDDRVSGWQMMYSLLESQSWVIAEECPKLIEILPSLGRDVDGNVEDVLKMDGDDPADSARYGLYSRLLGKREPIGSRVEKAVTSKDPTIQEIQRLVAAQREKGKGAGGPVRGQGHVVGMLWQPK